MRIGRARPQRGRIRFLLDQERAAGLRRVLAGHVERQHRDHALHLVRVILDPLPAAGDLIDPEKRDACEPAPAARRGGCRPASRGRRRAACRSRWRCRSRPVPARARRGRCARAGMRAAGDLGDQRAIRPPMENGLDVDMQVDVAFGELGTQPRRDPRGRLEPERTQRFNVGNAAPLQHVWRFRRPRVGAIAVEITPAAPRARTAMFHAWRQVAARQHQRALDVLAFIRRIRGAQAGIDQPQRDAAGRRAERIDRERNAMRVLREQDLAGRSAEPDGAAHVLPALAAVRILLVLRLQARRRRAGRR